VGSTIKYIHCLGTSYTAGGGFEFESPYETRSKSLQLIYGNLNEELTQNNFSYPGQLKKIIPNVDVINYGKNGYGNDRMYRLVYDIISDIDFNKDEHIFLLEFAGLGRHEYWSNDINDFIVLNYWVDWYTGSLKNEIAMANSYWYDNEETKIILKNQESFFLEFLKKTFNLNTEVNKCTREIDFFLSYLNILKINYFFLTSDDNKNSNKKFIFGDGVYFNQNNDFIKFTNINGLEIDIETDNRYIDKHNGYISNKIVSQTIYNTLIDMGLLDLKKINIDYYELRNFKLPKQKII
jgi:hypothetical protein